MKLTAYINNDYELVLPTVLLEKLGYKEGTPLSIDLMPDNSGFVIQHT